MQVYEGNWSEKGCDLQGYRFSLLDFTISSRLQAKFCVNLEKAEI